MYGSVIIYVYHLFIVILLSASSVNTGEWIQGTWKVKTNSIYCHNRQNTLKLTTKGTFSHGGTWMVFMIHYYPCHIAIVTTKGKVFTWLMMQCSFEAQVFWWWFRVIVWRNHWTSSRNRFTSGDKGMASWGDE